jgi:hypothetical protein
MHITAWCQMSVRLIENDVELGLFTFQTCFLNHPVEYGEHFGLKIIAV